MTRLYAGLAAGAVAALLGGSAWYVYSQQTGNAFASCLGGQVGGGDIGGAFTLVDETGATVTDAQVLTKPSLVYFGYTYCPDVCPIDSSRNAEAADILEQKGLDVQTVLITIDPERDTPEVLADYTANLHPKMIGLTGSADQIKTASLAYKTYYKKQAGEDYLMDHSTFTYLMLPGIGFADFFGRDVTAQAMADKAACFVTAAKDMASN